MINEQTFKAGMIFIFIFSAVFGVSLFAFMPRPERPYHPSLDPTAEERLYAVCTEINHNSDAYDNDMLIVVKCNDILEGR